MTLISSSVHGKAQCQFIADILISKKPGNILIKQDTITITLWEFMGGHTQLDRLLKPVQQQITLRKVSLEQSKTKQTKPRKPHKFSVP